MTDPGEEALQLLQRLVDWRALPVAELMPVPDGWTDRVNKAWLVEHAGEADVIELVRRAILQVIAWPSAGDPLPDQAHRDFLHLLQGLGGDDGKTVGARNLSRRMEASEQSLQRAIEQAEQRDRYLAALEVLREEPSELLTAEQRAYLNRIEQRMRERVSEE